MAPLSGDNGKNTTAAPGTGSRAYNSDNHEGAGQNVSFFDNHVEWTQNPYVGCSGDNIFTQGGPGVPGTPITTLGTVPAITGADFPYDTVMVPVRQTSGGGM
jgi:hypothetical protein